MAFKRYMQIFCMYLLSSFRYLRKTFFDLIIKFLLSDAFNMKKKPMPNVKVGVKLFFESNLDFEF